MLLGAAGGYCGTALPDRVYPVSYTHLDVYKRQVLGLAFKPGTDDLREAPSVDNIRLLLESGADVYAYDPAA